MKSFVYVSNTWLLAVLLHPFIFLFGTILFGGEMPDEILFVIAVLGFFFSLPAYFLCIVCLPGVLSMKANIVFQFLSWLFAISTCVFVCDILLSLLFGSSLDVLKETIVLSLPGLIAAWISAVIRFNQFKNLFTENHEAEYIN